MVAGEGFEPSDAAWSSNFYSESLLEEGSER